MSRKYVGRALLASCVAIAGVGVSATVAIGDLEDPAPVAAAALQQGLAAPASVERAAANPEFREFAVRPEGAVEVPAPAGAKTQQPWWVVPAGHGACLSPGNGALVCGTVSQLEAGQILFVELPLRPYADGPGPMVDPIPVRIAGLVSDGVTAVVATGADGREIGRSPATNNVYEIPLAARASGPLRKLELLGANGSAVTTLHIGGK